MSASEPRAHTSSYTLLFITILCAASALILALPASALGPAQDDAKQFDRSKQMLIAAKLYHPEGYFPTQLANGEYTPAKWDGTDFVNDDSKPQASDQLVKEVFDARIRAFKVTADGTRVPFESKEAELAYTNSNKKLGYANLPEKLIYEVVSKRNEPQGYVIPINGYGLWGTIYGYLALKPDGKTVIGISWYEHGETPGLGAVISEYGWQSQFSNKSIVMLDPSKGLTFDNSPIGITVVRGKVKGVINDPLKASAAVDGISGATLTGNGVTKAYKDCLGPYRPFLKKLQRNL